MDSIEDIILDRDGRNISALRPHLRERFCDDAAAMVYDCPGTAIIVTGFHILAAGATETDGPPGAIAIGRALQKLGNEVVLRDGPLYGACDGRRWWDGKTQVHRLSHRES